MNITKKYIFSSESVSEGHPDKLADLISDSILDACLAQDPDSRVACETMVKDNIVTIGGEITTKAVVDYEAVARAAIDSVQCGDPEYNGSVVKVDVNISTQSPDIAQGVDARAAEGKEGAEQGAGDQGIMFGYATNETPEMLPATLVYAHRITKALAEMRKGGEAPMLRADAKSQVSIEYEEDVRELGMCTPNPNRKAVRVDTVVVSTQHAENASREDVEAVCRRAIEKSIPSELIDEKTKILINPTGRFVIGGPKGDCGLTGRKIIVDTYGGAARHGGGAFSGKDCSKVDRSGAYMCRWVAKHIVEAGLAKRCEIQVAYAIGKAEPVSIMVDTFGCNYMPEEAIERLVRKNFSFKPADIERSLGLRAPIYAGTTNYGHFGKDNLPWEKCDPVIVKRLRKMGFDWHKWDEEWALKGTCLSAQLPYNKKVEEFIMENFPREGVRRISSYGEVYDVEVGNAWSLVFSREKCVLGYTYFIHKIYTREKIYSFVKDGRDVEKMKVRGRRLKNHIKGIMDYYYGRHEREAMERVQKNLEELHLNKKQK